MESKPSSATIKWQCSNVYSCLVNLVYATRGLLLRLDDFRKWLHRNCLFDCWFGTNHSLKRDTFGTLFHRLESIFIYIGFINLLYVCIFVDELTLEYNLVLEQSWGLRWNEFVYKMPIQFTLKIFGLYVFGNRDANREFHSGPCA